MIKEIFARQDKTFSFEFFPPKNYQSTLELGVNIGKLVNLDPTFVSVTYGAGGSNQDASFDLCDYMQNKIGWLCMAHYTCVNASREKIEADLDHLYNIGIRNLMLLRGDAPKGQEEYFAQRSEFKHASELVAIAKAQDRFCIGVAGYPEAHVESPDSASDIFYLKQKVAAGGDFVVTQMFFDNQYYFDFVEKATAAGINQRIIPGIIPITNFKQIKRFSQIGGSYIPEWISDKLEPYQDDKEKSYQLGVEIAVAQCEDLLRNGAPGIHFYTLNKSEAALDIFSAIPKDLKDVNKQPVA